MEVPLESVLSQTRCPFFSGTKKLDLKLFQLDIDREDKTLLIYYAKVPVQLQNIKMQRILKAKLLNTGE